MVKTFFSKTDFFSNIFQSDQNIQKVLPRTFKNNHKEINMIRSDICSHKDSNKKWSNIDLKQDSRKNIQETRVSGTKTQERIKHQEIWSVLEAIFIVHEEQ